MPEGRKKRLDHRDYTVAIICPLEVELSAMRLMLEDEHAMLPPKAGDTNGYICGEMSGHNIVIGYLPYGSQGIGAAASVATHMERTFPSIKLRMLVGIGGGVPSDEYDIRLGDVVIGMPDRGHGGVIQYDLGKETLTGFQRKGHLDAPPTIWRDAVVRMRSDHRNKRKQQMWNFLSEAQSRGYSCPAPEKDVLFLNDSPHVPNQPTCAQCDKTRTVTRTSRDPYVPSIFYGLIASGDRVMKNAKKRDKISQELGGALCFEMEAAGSINDFHCIVIRGIADYADSHKNDDWHAYAAATAAACAKELLTYVAPVVARSPEPPKSEPTKFSNIPKLLVKDFVGRKAELQDIEEHFTSRVPDGPRIIIISALGGQGKSQIALEYCRRMKPVYKGLFWVNASFKYTAKRSFSEVAKALGQPVVDSESEDDQVQFVCDTLAEWEDRWLMVFDNYDDPDNFGEVMDFIPHGTEGDVLFTSRCQDLDRLGETINIPPLATDDGVALLLRSFRGVDVEKHRPEAEKIVKRLGGLALAIDQAAAYIRYRRLSVGDLRGFVELYEEQREKILTHTPDRFWEYGVFGKEKEAREKALSAFTTWEMSFQQLCQKYEKIADAVARFLTLSAFLAAIPINEWLFINHRDRKVPPDDWTSIFSLRAGYDGTVRGEGDDSAVPPPGSEDHVDWDTYKFWDLIHEGNQLSLVQEISRSSGQEGATFVFHPLIRDWLQLRQSPKERQNFTKEAMWVIVDSIIKFEKSTVVASVKQTLLLHIDAAMENDEKFSKKGCRIGEEMKGDDAGRDFATFCWQQGRYALSAKLWQIVRRTREVELGKEHKSTLAAMNDQALVAHEQGNYPDAEKLYREVLRLKRKVLGSEHPDTLVTMNNLGILLREESAYEESEQLHRKVLKIQQQLPNDHPDVLHSRVHLAAVLCDRGKFKEAEHIYREVLEIRKRVLGDQHEDTLVTRHNLGLALLHQREYAEAEVIYRDVLKIREEVLGMEHPETLSSRNNLAEVLNYQRKTEEAEALFRETLRSEEKVLGPSHPNMIRSRHNLAWVLEGQGRDDEVEALYRDVHKARTKLLGPEHPATLLTMNNLAVLLTNQGRFSEAEKLYKKTVAGRIKVLGRDHADTVASEEDYEWMREKRRIKEGRDPSPERRTPDTTPERSPDAPTKRKHRQPDTPTKRDENRIHRRKPAFGERRIPERGGGQYERSLMETVGLIVAVRSALRSFLKGDRY
ncbi:uncharacterized protein Z518_04791 [Rhinocladiella mackenziei CBS 650.93]|uniref:NB-ARC domain-containing protein n=1 Tax=Rhinocladiella mackenziei CBS 650.93 TaxID=1442369 RepID=A0A0D2JCH7_9EURO|nr:uncharacterized protein Z518_04791 [Rhinocladiella mackenziei CBS 650.93]KIX06815.1 hypothetical protein Z518_04791 [Rhinocladiella mackenziei CBS 650.93]